MSTDSRHHRPYIGVTDVLRVVETFGPTIQGEGTNVGRAAMFVRLYDCNLSCSWCDTAFSWDPNRPDPGRPARDRTATDIAAALDPRTVTPEVNEPPVTHLVVTGGEPLLQARELTGLVRPLRQLGWTIEVETSGTLSPAPLLEFVSQFNVSPKLRNSGVAERARIRPHVLQEFANLPNAVFKFVVDQTSDLEEVADMVGALGLPGNRVLVMAQGTSSAQVLRGSRELVDAVAARGWGLTPRWHTILWEDVRGR